ncbi:response regulator [Ornithinimicrobium humiphilum]
MIANVHAKFVSSIAGFRVVGTANTGMDAIEQVANKGPQLILLDVHLPDIDGLEVLRRLRQAGHDVDAIVITAERDAGYVKTALRWGVSQYLVKPFDLVELGDRMSYYRDSLQVMSPGGLDQEFIDTIFPAPHQRRPASPLPKGLSRESAEVVREVVRGRGEISAQECAEATGMARTSARRYLEHLAHIGELRVRLQYGAGRPTRLYSLPSTTDG